MEVYFATGNSKLPATPITTGFITIVTTATSKISNLKARPHFVVAVITVLMFILLFLLTRENQTSIPTVTREVREPLT
jgi:RsiW-degrading membrane proteinase PrsW (M82 family)